MEKGSLKTIESLLRSVKDAVCNNNGQKQIFDFVADIKGGGTHILKAERGMTWYDWINSQYNTIGARLGNLYGEQGRIIVDEGYYVRLMVKNSLGIGGEEWVDLGGANGDQFINDVIIPTDGTSLRYYFGE